MQATALDVAIVGGGPAGLATACAIRRRCPELRVRVFERAPAVQRKGQWVAQPMGACENSNTRYSMPASALRRLPCSGAMQALGWACIPTVWQR